jgi:hypothetical protein
LPFKSARTDADVTRMEYVSRCPACSALVRRDQDWCTLCHADLRPPEQRPSAAAEEPAAPTDTLELLPSAAAALMLDERPAAAAQPAGKHARPSGPEAPAGVPEGKLDDAEIEALIVQLAAESPDPVSGLMSRLPESQSMRVILALMVGGAVATLLVGLSYLLGVFVN